jgi:hypothetical protein
MVHGALHCLCLLGFGGIQLGVAFRQTVPLNAVLLEVGELQAATNVLRGVGMHKKILIMGLQGAGKTTLARHLAPRLNAVHYNADDVRANVNRDLGISESDRVEHAHRVGWLCDQVVKAGCFAVADFICPTPRARGVLRGRFWVRDLDRSSPGRSVRGYESIVCAA